MAETPPPATPTTEAAPSRPAPDREPLWRDALGECLRSLRHERGEKLADTASRAGISPQYLSEMERGVKDPSSEMIAAVAGALDLTLADLAAAVAERTRAPRTTAPAAHGPAAGRPALTGTGRAAAYALAA